MLRVVVADNSVVWTRKIKGQTRMTLTEAQHLVREGLGPSRVGERGEDDPAGYLHHPAEAFFGLTSST